MQGNVPLQQRGGQNPQSRAYGHPLVATARSRVFRASGNQDNILLSGSGKEQRAFPLGAEAVAVLYNFTGGQIDFAAYFVDEQNNEYPVEIGLVADGGTNDIDMGEGLVALAPGEKIILRITGGDPSAGDGLNVMVGHITVPEDMAIIRKEISDTSVVELFAADPGELLLSVGVQGEAETLLIANGDDIDHTFDVYISEGGQDYLVEKATLIGTESVNGLGIFEEFGGLSYGQTVKLKMLQAKNNASSRVLFLGTMMKVALSKDDTP